MLPLQTFKLTYINDILGIIRYVALEGKIIKEEFKCGHHYHKSRLSKLKHICKWFFR